LEPANRLRVTTSRGSVDPLLELEDAPLDVTPGERLPPIRRAVARGHGVLAHTRSPTFQGTVPTSACPWAFPRAFASWAIPPGRGMRLTPAPVRRRTAVGLPRSSSLSCAGRRALLFAGVLEDASRVRLEGRPGVVAPFSSGPPVPHARFGPSLPIRVGSL